MNDELKKELEKLETNEQKDEAIANHFSKKTLKASHKYTNTGTERRAHAVKARSRTRRHSNISRRINKDGTKLIVK